MFFFQNFGKIHFNVLREFTQGHKITIFFKEFNTVLKSNNRTISRAPYISIEIARFPESIVVVFVLGILSMQGGENRRILFFFYYFMLSIFEHCVELVSKIYRKYIPLSFTTSFYPKCQKFHKFFMCVV